MRVPQDRATEHSKVGKDWKFSLLLALNYSPHIELLVDTISQKIQSIIREGWVTLHIYIIYLYACLYIFRLCDVTTACPLGG